MPVFQQQFAPVFEITVRDVNKRLAEVGERKQKLLLHTFPVAVGDFINTALWIELIGEELLFVAELFSEERVDESNIVMDATGLENLFPAQSQTEIPLSLRNVVVAFIVVLTEFSTIPAVFNVLPEFETEPVWVDLA